MSEFPSVEADELVTKQFLWAALALTRGEVRAEMADLGTGLRDEMAELRLEMEARFHLALQARTVVVSTGARWRNLGVPGEAE